MNPNAIVQKLWNYCNILRDDGLSYQDYIEQLTLLRRFQFIHVRIKGRSPFQNEASLKVSVT